MTDKIVNVGTPGHIDHGTVDSKAIKECSDFNEIAEFFLEKIHMLEIESKTYFGSNMTPQDDENNRCRQQSCKDRIKKFKRWGALLQETGRCLTLNESLQEELDLFRKLAGANEDHVMELLKQLQEAREVIEFYASPEIWGEDDWQIKAVNVSEYSESGKLARQWQGKYR